LGVCGRNLVPAALAAERPQGSKIFSTKNDFKELRLFTAAKDSRYYKLCNT